MNNLPYIVTGASSGIGLAITKILLNSNHTVIAIARSIETCEISTHQNVRPVTMDFSNTNTTISNLERLKTSIDSLGGIICCAGFGKFATLEQFSYQQITDQINVNLMAHIHLCKTFVPLLKKQKSGKIIFLGSDAALRGSQQGSIYCASKFAIRGFSQALRQECSRSNVAVSLVNPGMLDTAFYDKLNFRPGNAPENIIDMKSICSTVKLIIDSPSHMVFDEINISPLKHVVEKKIIQE